MLPSSVASLLTMSEEEKEKKKQIYKAGPRRRFNVELVAESLLMYDERSSDREPHFT